jgi:uncharacterized protein YjaG (DUF416 family)
MRNKFSLILLAILFVVSNAHSQPSPSAKADSIFNMMMPAIRPAHSNWVKSAAVQFNARQLKAEEAIPMTIGYAILGSMPEGDIEALAFLVLMQAARAAQEDIRSIMERTKAINEQKAKHREALQNRLRNNVVNAKEFESIRAIAYDSKVLLAKAKVDSLRQSKKTMADTNPSRAEVQALVADMQKDLDSMSEMGEMESLRLQMAMDRMSKMMSTLSNILKKISDTAQSITQNLK